MSLLLGVRGSSQKNEGKPFHEGIVQQPGSFYNGNPSSSIWGNSPTLPLWHDLPLPDGPLFSSSITTSSSVSSPSLMAKQELHDRQWQHSYVARERPNQEFDISPASKEGFYADNINQFSNVSGPVSQSTMLEEGTNGFRFLFKGSAHKSFGTGKATGGSLDAGKKASIASNVGTEDENIATFAAADKYSRQGLGFRVPGSLEDLQNDFQSKLSMQGPTTLSKPLFLNAYNLDANEAKQNSKSQTLEDNGESVIQMPRSSTSWSFTEPHSVSSGNETPEVFIFGASGSSGTGQKSGLQQQKSFSDMAAASSRLRTSKFKRQSNAVKGTGLVVHGGAGSQQVPSHFTRDALPRSISGLESGVGSMPCGEAECLDSGILLGVCNNMEKIEFFQPLDLSDEEVGTPTWSFKSAVDYTHPGFIFSQQDFSSHAEGKDPLNKQKQSSGSYSFTFSKEVNGEVPEPIREPKSENSATNLVPSMGGFGASAGRPDPCQVNLVPSYGEDNLKNSQNVVKISEPLNEKSYAFDVSEDCFNKKPIDVATSNVHNQNESSEFVWETRSQEHAKPFTFGSSRASTSQADSFGKKVDGGLGTNLCVAKDDLVQTSSKSLLSGSDEQVQLRFTSSATPFMSTSMNAISMLNKGLSSIDKPFVFLTNAEPAITTYKSSTLCSPFVEPDNECPTGEFSGPISSSESESSPDRRDKPVTTDKCFTFQGNTKEELLGPAMVKKKTRASLHRRKHGRGLNRQKRVMDSGSFNKASATPMDFSPVTSAPLNVGEMDLEQPYPNLSKQTLNMDETELWKHLAEIESLKEHSFGDSPQNVSFNLEDFGMSEDLRDWAEPSLSSKRNERWKRSISMEGERPSNHMLNPWMAQNSEREEESLSGSHSIFDTTQSIPRTTFTFGVSSLPAVSSSTETTYGQIYEAERAADVVSSARESYPSTIGQEGSSIVHEALSKDGVRRVHKSGPLDSKGPPMVLRTSSLNRLHTSSQNNSAEELETLKAGDTISSASSGHTFTVGLQGSASAVSAAVEQVCERWRLRGNQAYANGDFPKAEEYYSRGASSVSPDETSQSCIRASMLCYSNRAATRMAVGRMREALADCKRAMVVDPSFLRVKLRAASCHLALGEIKAATDMFKDCVKYAKEGNVSDSKILAEALEGAKKCQQVDEYSERALELLQEQNLTDLMAALRLVNEALSTSSYSEPLHELKAQSLLLLRRYEEVLQFCDQSLPAAERNHGIAVIEQPWLVGSVSDLGQSKSNLDFQLWRWRANAKALYHLGRLDEAFELLTKHEDAISTTSMQKDASVDSLAPFMASIRDLLRHKAAGNEAFQLGKHAEAIEHYTAALACNGESRPYIAVCFCNRAAASQALGHIADAIADCSRAIALDSVYPKALSRRATLHEIVRDHGQACNDLRRLVTLLEEQLHVRIQANKGGSSNTNTQDLKQARERLEKAEEEIKKGHPIDHYLILGVDFSCSANEIKKAYRKAALKHHPDKAGQFLARGENGDDGSLWKEVGDEVRGDAERLFKLIGEAYAILSDPTKRLRYDAEEEHRKLRVKDSSAQVSRSTSSEGYRSQYEKSSRRQGDRWDSWQAFAPPHQQQQQRWQSGPDAAQPDTYGRRSTYGADPFKMGRTSWSDDFSWYKL